MSSLKIQDKKQLNGKYVMTKDKSTKLFLEEGDEYYIIDGDEIVWTVFDDNSVRQELEFYTRIEAEAYLENK